MQKVSNKTLGLRKEVRTSIKIPVTDYRSLSVPSIAGVKMGNCFVKVTDIPIELENFMDVNPRLPSRDSTNALKGPVIKGILDTLFEKPEDMAIKNQGIFLLVDEVKTYKAEGGDEFIQLILSDNQVHGVVNGGHTFAAVMHAIENADESAMASLNKAFIRLHILSGVEKEKVAEMAEGLNRSKQVDNPSLENLKGQFVKIKERMKGELGANKISYHQGDEGEFYIAHVLSLMEMFNLKRFPEDKFPTSLYNSTQYGLKYFLEDTKKNPEIAQMLISKLPEILKLHDTIKSLTPDSAKKHGYSFDSKFIQKTKGGALKPKPTQLYFIDSECDHKVYNGWAYPMISAFRANVDWKPEQEWFEWLVPIEKLLPLVIDSLVGVCVRANNDNAYAPDKVGKQSSVYDACYSKVEKAVGRYLKSNS